MVERHDWMIPIVAHVVRPFTRSYGALSVRFEPLEEFVESLA